MNKIKNYLKDNDINLLAAFLLPLIFTYILYINRYSWGNGTLQSGMASSVQQIFSLLWLIPLPIALLSLLGIFLYKRGAHLEEIEVPYLSGTTIYFRLVTRGINQKTVTRTANNVVKTMELFNICNNVKIPYVIEVITEQTDPSLVDTISQSFYGDKITVIELPKHYFTSKNAVYKARALHYALEYSSAQDHDWIFHLDDESQIDKHTVLGILEFVSKEEKKIFRDFQHKPLIGQGTILYYRKLRQNVLYTLADSIRTADDVGRYFLQYLLHVCVFGMHGSFILTRNSVEKEEGFDFNPVYCITEDAYWGLKMMQRGYKFGHVYGFVHEQSPEKGLDFIKQRRRWFLGLTKVLQAHDIAFRYKVLLLFSTSLWALSGFVLLYTALNILHPVALPVIVGILSSLAFSIYVLMYMLGFYINMQYAKVSFYRKIVLLVAQVILIPVFSLLEAAGAFYGLLDRKLNFHVIKK